jgi:hypothetical protein
MPHQPPQQPAQLPQTVENYPERALALGWMQVRMGNLDNDQALVRNGENLIRRAQEVLARRQAARQSTGTTPPPM